MSHLLSRILLAMLMLPLAAMVYVVVFFVNAFRNGWGSDMSSNVVAGGVTWVFMAVYWYLLWRRAVRWTRRRVLLTAGAVLVSAAAGVAIWLGLSALVTERE